jgi:uncharacterized protein involved in exopolysaccharide biosynthesis
VEDEISLLDLLNVLLKRRGTVVVTTVAVAVLALVLVLLTPRTYTASTSFVSQGYEPGASRLAGIASQFGFRLPSESPGESPQFYAELVESREILGVLAEEEVAFQSRKGDEVVTLAGTLPDVLEVDEELEPEVREEVVVRWLRNEAVSVTTGRETGIVEVSVRTPWAGLSWILAERILELVNGFNLQTRQSRAAAERSFVEARLDEAQEALRAAEDRLERFMENNRLWDNSPELAFQHDRLTRQVAMRQQVYTSLAEAYEQARITEVRNTPVITVVEEPERPVRPDSRQGTMKLALGVVLGGMLGVFLAFGREYLHRARTEGDEEYREFSTLWSQTWTDVRSLGGLLGRKKG